MWQKVSLGEIVKNLDSRRIPLNSAEREKKSGQKLYPYIGANNIKEYISEYIFDEKILCVAEDGGNWGPGQVCAVIYEGRTWVNNHAHVLIENGKAKLEYLRYFLNEADLTKYITGATRGKLTRSALDSIQVPLPPIDQQIKIANILGKAESLIKQRKESLRLLDELLKSTFLEMFGDSVKNEKGWKTLTGEQYCEKITVGVVIKPASYYVETGVIALRSLNIRPNRIDLSNVVYFSREANERELSKSKLSAGDVVFVRTGATGTAATIPRELDGCNCIDLIVTRPKNQTVSPTYLVFFFNSDFGKRLVSSKEVGGIQKHFNIGAIRALKIPIPPLELQKEFAHIVAKAEILKDHYQNSLVELESLYASLSQKVFKGELQFKVDTKVVPLLADEKEEDYFKKRKGLACYIINQSLDDEKFGDTKFEKLLNLSDQYAIQRNLGQTYYQKVAGPYDNGFTKLFYIQIAAENLYKRKRSGKQSVFIPGSNHKKTFTAANYFSNDELARVDKLITYFKKYTYEQPEIISTLYAVWNNRIIRQQQITDEVLKRDFLDWDEKKKKYKDRLDAALAWMKKESIIPNGWGKLIEKPKGKQRKLVVSKKSSNAKRAS